MAALSSGETLLMSILMKSAYGTRGSPGVTGYKIVQRDPISPLFKPLAHGNDGVIGGDGLLNLNHNLGRQQGEVLHQQHLVRTVDEGAMPIAQHVEPDQTQGVNDGAGHALHVRGSVRFAAVLLKQQFVAEHLLVGGENRVPRHAG
jgi:hypothetical protein